MEFDKNMILDADDIEIKEVPLSVPGWPERVWVRTLSGAERDAWEAGIVSQDGRGKKSVNLKNIRASLACLVVCDESGKRIFADGDVQQLGTKSAKALDAIFDAGQELNGLRDEDIEELAGNSGATHDAVSTSD